jgi:hypothetical protein
MNIKLLKKVKRHIMRHANKFGMSLFTYTNECGTAHCIAGWICELKEERLKTTETAADLIEVNHEYAWDLFYMRWPEPYKQQYLDLCTDRESGGKSWAPKRGNRVKAAKIACQVIDLFIQNGGKL